MNWFHALQNILSLTDWYNRDTFSFSPTATKNFSLWLHVIIRCLVSCSRLSLWSTVVEGCSVKKKKKRKELKDLFVYNEEQTLPARWLYSMIDTSCENFYSWYSCSLRNKVTNITQKFFFLNACFKGLITCSLVRDALELFRIKTFFNKRKEWNRYQLRKMLWKTILTLFRQIFIISNITIFRWFTWRRIQMKSLVRTLLKVF